MYPTLLEDGKMWSTIVPIVKDFLEFIQGKPFYRNATFFKFRLDSNIKVIKARFRKYVKKTAKQPLEYLLEKILI